MLNQERNLERTSLAKGKKRTIQTNKQQQQQQQQSKTERKEQHIIIVNKQGQVKNSSRQLILPRIREPYRKLRTEFFPPRFMAQARSARAINRRRKNEDPYLTVRTEKTKLVRYLLYL